MFTNNSVGFMNIFKMSSSGSFIISMQTFEIRAKFNCLWVRYLDVIVCIISIQPLFLFLNLCFDLIIVVLSFAVVTSFFQALKINGNSLRKINNLIIINIFPLWFSLSIDSKRTEMKQFNKLFGICLITLLWFYTSNYAWQIVLICKYL